MAEIIINGGVRIIPKKLPVIVSAHRNIDTIKRRIEIMHDELRDTPLTKERLEPISKKTVQLQDEYMKTLEDCGKALESEMKGMSPDNRAYYEPVHEIGERPYDPQ
jgi:hypothetical protein